MRVIFSRSAQPLAIGLAGASPIFATLHCRRKDATPNDCTIVSCETSSGGNLEAKFSNMHKKGLVPVGQWHLVNSCPPMSAREFFSSMRYFWNIHRDPVTVRVRDARQKEAEEGLSKADFFKRYGFVLINHKTAMDAQDWNASAPRVLGVSNLTGYGMNRDETPLSRIYWKEVEQIIRDLMPDSKDLELDPEITRRGPGTKNPNYNFAPHQDYGFTPEDWPLAGPEFHAHFEREDVRGLVVANFWRPVRPMQGPVKKTPLAVCDPRSVKMEDIVPLSVKRDPLGYTKMLDLAYDKDQEWYYYPDMTVDEVLVFKSFQYFKSQAGPELNTVFHTAFEVPSPPPGVEERQSCEYRVRIWF